MLLSLFRKFQSKMHLFLVSLACLALPLTAQAQSTVADSVSTVGTASVLVNHGCKASVSVTSDGSIAGSHGFCPNITNNATYTIKFAFSPTDAQRMNSFRVWPNAGGVLYDGELRQFDLEIDHFNPVTGQTETLTISDHNMGVTRSWTAPKVVPFGVELFRVSEVRMSDMRAHGTYVHGLFREAQGFYVTRSTAPEIEISSSEGGALIDGGTDAHGLKTAGVSTTVTYTITNSGTGTLSLPSTPTLSNLVNIAGTPTVGPLSTNSLAPGGTATFSVTYTKVAAGPFSFDVEVPNNDADEGPFNVTASGTSNGVPSVVLSGPTEPQSGPFTVTATFSEAVTGLELAEFVIGNGTASNFAMIAPNVYTILVTPSAPGVDVTVNLPAGVAVDGDSAPNSASNALRVSGGALSEVEKKEITGVVVEQEARQISSQLAFNQRSMRGARGRHIAGRKARRANQQGSADGALNFGPTDYCEVDELRDDTASSLNTDLNANEDGANVTGSFFWQRSRDNCERRRLVFGDFDLTRYNGADVTATFNGRIAWERLVGKEKDVVIGAFIGANLSQTNVGGNFSGKHLQYGVSAGAYFVDELVENLFWDGFLTVGYGLNSLDLGNGVKTVGSEYGVMSYQVGMALTGVKEYKRFELRPALSIAYGQANVGDVNLSVTTAASTLSETISAGRVAMGSIGVTPEIVFTRGVAGRWYDEREINISPNLSCEHTTSGTPSTACGGGLEVEWIARAYDGSGQFSAHASRHIIGGETRDTLGISFNREF